MGKNEKAAEFLSGLGECMDGIGGGVPATATNMGDAVGAHSTPGVFRVTYKVGGFDDRAGTTRSMTVRATTASEAASACRAAHPGCDIISID